MKTLEQMTMKTVEDLTKSIVDKVRVISPKTKITDMDTAIAGITISTMYEEDIRNLSKRNDINFRSMFSDETGKCCTLDRTKECDSTRVFSHEYVEWLENIIKGKKRA